MLKMHIEILKSYLSITKVINFLHNKKQNSLFMTFITIFLYIYVSFYLLLQYLSKNENTLSDQIKYSCGF